MARRWFTFRGPDGREWSAWLVPASHDHLRRKPPAKPYLGWTAFDERAVFINEDLSPEEQDETALHEIAHAVLDGARIPRSIEERVLHKLDVRLLPVLQHFGFRLPKRPRRRARRRS